MLGPQTFAPEHKMMNVKLGIDIIIHAGSFSTKLI